MIIYTLYKSIEYTKYFVNRGHNLKSVQQCFNTVGKTSQQEAQKKVKPSKTHGPNINKIINRNIHLLLNNDNLKELYPKGIILVANKREKNLQQLLLRSDPYNIKDDQQLKEDCGYTKCFCKNRDSCNNFVDETTYIECNATGRKYKIRRDTACSLRNVIYVAYCIKCMKQGVGSTTSWKPCLSNYKSHIKKKKLTCRTVKHFIENCNDNGFNNLRFTKADLPMLK